MVLGGASTVCVCFFFFFKSCMWCGRDQTRALVLLLSASATWGTSGEITAPIRAISDWMSRWINNTSHSTQKLASPVTWQPHVATLFRGENCWARKHRPRAQMSTRPCLWIRTDSFFPLSKASAVNNESYLWWERQGETHATSKCQSQTVHCLCECQPRLSKD